MSHSFSPDQKTSLLQFKEHNLAEAAREVATLLLNAGIHDLRSYAETLATYSATLPLLDQPHQTASYLSVAPVTPAPKDLLYLLSNGIDTLKTRILPCFDEEGQELLEEVFFSRIVLELSLRQSHLEQFPTANQSTTS